METIEKFRVDQVLDEQYRATLSAKWQKYRLFIEQTRNPKKTQFTIMRNHLKNIYHSNAIEGSSLTYRQTKLVLKTGKEIAGKLSEEHADIYGLKAALGYLHRIVEDEDSRQIGHLKMILELNRRVKVFHNPIEAGTFRLHDAQVGDHNAPSPTQLNVLMARFVEWLRTRVGLLNYDDSHSQSIEKSALLVTDVVVVAALAHYGLVYVHPFNDGNGRTSRLLMNYYFLRAGFPLICIHKKRRNEYYKALHQAEANHDLGPFVKFIAAETIRTIDSILQPTAKLRLISHQIVDSFSLRSACCCCPPVDCCNQMCCCLSLKEKPPQIKLDFEGMTVGSSQNIETCQDLAAKIGRNFGPNGVVMSQEGEMFSSAENKFPKAGCILMEGSNQQRQTFNDGGKTVVILGATLLEQAGILLDMGCKSNELANIYNMVFAKIQNELAEHIKISIEKDGTIEQFVPAAGGAELQIARQLDNWAVDKELNSVQKLAISGFSFALRTVPATLAEVAAKSKYRTVGQLVQFYYDRLPKEFADDFSTSVECKEMEIFPIEGILTKLLRNETKVMCPGKWNKKFFALGHFAVEDIIWHGAITNFTNTMARGIDPNTGELVQTDKLARPFDQFETKINAWHRAIESVIKILQMEKMVDDANESPSACSYSGKRQQN